MADDTTALAVNGARHYIDLILQRNPTDPQDIFNPTSAEDAAKLDDTRLITKLEVITNAYHEASRFFNRFVVAHLPAFLELQKRMNSRGSKGGKQFRVNGKECAGFKDALVALGFNPSYFYTVVREIRGKEIAKLLGAGDRSAAASKANETRKSATETSITDITLDDATDAEECEPEPELKVEVLNAPDAPEKLKQHPSTETVIKDFCQVYSAKTERPERLYAFASQLTLQVAKELMAALGVNIAMKCGDTAPEALAQVQRIVQKLGKKLEKEQAAAAAA